MVFWGCCKVNQAHVLAQTSCFKKNKIKWSRPTCCKLHRLGCCCLVRVSPQSSLWCVTAIISLDSWEGHSERKCMNFENIHNHHARVMKTLFHLTQCKTKKRHVDGAAMLIVKTSSRLVGTLKLRPAVLFLLSWTEKSYSAEIKYIRPSAAHAKEAFFGMQTLNLTRQHRKLISTLNETCASTKRRETSEKCGKGATNFSLIIRANALPPSAKRCGCCLFLFYFLFFCPHYHASDAPSLFLNSLY